MPVINAMEEIRSKRFYIPELELLMVDQQDEPIGYCMFSRFHLEGICGQVSYADYPCLR